MYMNVIVVELLRLKSDQETRFKQEKVREQ